MVFHMLRTLHLEKFEYVLQSSSWRFLFVFVSVGWKLLCILYVYETELILLDAQEYSS